MFILGLGYQRRQGKDSLAHFIHERCGTPMRRIITLASFAGALKQEVNADFVQYVSHTEGLNLHKDIDAHGGGENWPHSDRPYLQLLWEDWFRVRTLGWGYEKKPLLPLQWNDPLSLYGKCVEGLQWWGTEYRRGQDPEYWIKKAKHTIDNTHANAFIFTDCRFPNEAELIKSMGGEVWAIHRVGGPDVSSSHASESSLADWHFDRRIYAADLKTLSRIGIAYFESAIERHNALD